MPPKIKLFEVPQPAERPRGGDGDMEWLLGIICLGSGALWVACLVALFL